MTSRSARPGRRRVRGIVAALLFLAAAGCAGHGPSFEPAPGTQALVRSELYFGRLQPDGTVVSDAEWRTFVAEEITPRFPDGFTVFDALGQYRGRDGQIVSEPTKVLLDRPRAGCAPARLGPGAPRPLPAALPAGVGAPDRKPRPRRILTRA